MNESFEFSRRHFIKVAAAGLALSQTLEAKMINSRIHGVYVGIQTFSLRGLRYDAVIPALKQLGIGECELVAGQIEPLATDVPDLAKWRATVSLDYFADMRKKFNQAGISIHGYNGRFGAAPAGRGGRGARGAGGPGGPGGPGAPGAGPGPAAGPAAQPPTAPPAAPATPPPAPAPVTDEEIDRTFQIAKALGAKSINGQVQPAIADRVGRGCRKIQYHHWNLLTDTRNFGTIEKLPLRHRYRRLHSRRPRFASIRHRKSR